MKMEIRVWSGVNRFENLNENKFCSFQEEKLTKIQFKFHFICKSWEKISLHSIHKSKFFLKRLNFYNQIQLWIDKTYNILKYISTGSTSSGQYVEEERGNWNRDYQGELQLKKSFKWKVMGFTNLHILQFPSPSK